MMLMIKGPLPTEADKLKILYDDFKDTVNWKVQLKIDEIEQSKRRAADAHAQREFAS